MDKIKIITVDDCEPCDKIKDKLKDTVEYINANSDEGREILGDVENISVPLAVDEKGEFCELFMSDDIILVKCGDKERVIYDKNKEGETTTTTEHSDENKEDKTIITTEHSDEEHSDEDKEGEV